MKNIKTISLSIFVLIFLALISCGKNDHSEDYSVGVILPLTGDAAAYGNNLLRGIEFAHESSDDSVKRQINLVIEDSGNNSNILSIYEKLKNFDGVNAIIGPFGSSEVLSIAAQANQDEIIILAPTATSPEISDAGEFVYRIIPSDLFDSKVLANYAFSINQDSTFSTVYINNEYGVGFNDSFKKQITALGGRTTSNNQINQGTNNFRTVIEKIKVEAPNAVLVVGINEIGYFLRQSEELGLNAQVYSTGMMENNDVINIAGNSASGVIYTYPSFSLENASLNVLSFANNFKLTYDSEPGILEALGYDAFNIISKALLNSNSEPGMVQRRLNEITNFQGVSGEMTFDENGDVVKPIGIKKVDNANEFVWINREFKITN